MKFREFIEKEVEEDLEYYKSVGFDKGKEGKFKPHSFDRKHGALIRSPAYAKRLHTKFSKTKWPFAIYIANIPGGRKFLERGEMQLDDVEKQLGIELHDDYDDHITVIYTNNTGDQKVPMTPWILAHRFGHAIRNLPEWNDVVTHVNEKLAYIMRKYYGTDVKFNRDGFISSGYGDDDRRRSQDNENKLKHFMHSVGTFKSARDRKIRNFPEIYYELLAQYILTGKIRFNDLQQLVPIKYAWGNVSHGLRGRGPEGDRDYYNGILKDLEESFVEYADDFLNSLIGRIFVV